MKKTIKSTAQALDSNVCTKIKIKKGRGKLVRIDAIARFSKSNEDPFFSKWVSYKHANSVYKYIYGKNINESNNFYY